MSNPKITGLVIFNNLRIGSVIITDVDNTKASGTMMPATSLEGMRVGKFYMDTGCVLKGSKKDIEKLKLFYVDGHEYRRDAYEIKILKRVFKGNQLIGYEVFCRMAKPTTVNLRCEQLYDLAEYLPVAGFTLIKNEDGRRHLSAIPNNKYGIVSINNIPAVQVSKEFNKVLKERPEVGPWCKGVSYGIFDNKLVIRGEGVLERFSGSFKKYLNILKSVNEIQMNTGITGIQYSALSVFDNKTSIKKVILPNSLQVIGDNAFSNLKSLQRVVMPETLDEIGSKAFMGCESIKSIKIPEGIEKIPSDVFRGCKSLQSVSLPSTLKYIDECAFYGCEQLKSVKLPDSILGVKKSAFEKSGVERIEYNGNLKDIM